MNEFVASIISKAKNAGIDFRVVGGLVNNKVDLSTSDVDIFLRTENGLSKLSNLILSEVGLYPNVVLVSRREISNYGWQFVFSYKDNYFKLDLFVGLRFSNIELMDSKVFFDLASQEGNEEEIYRFIKKNTAFKDAWPGVPREVYRFAVDRVTFPKRVCFYFIKLFENIKSLMYERDGVMVAFLGPDGSGKSSVINSIEAKLCGKKLVIPVKRFHWRPELKEKKQSPTIVVDPHGDRPRGSIMSFVKLCYLAMVFNLGYLLRVKRLLHRGYIVLFDRYYHDLLVDQKRYRYGGSTFLAKVVGKLIPQPDMWILLDASADILYQRKQEVSYSEVVKQVDGYRDLIDTLDNGHTIDATQPLDEVVKDIDKVLVEFLSNRMSRNC